MTKLLIAAALLLSSALAFSQASHWKNERGEPIPDTEFRKTKNDFGGWLLVTSDEDWETKWNTPKESVPSFAEAGSVALGQRLFVLIFFSNPALTPDRGMTIRCDIKITRPNQTISINEKDLTCLDGRIDGSPLSVFLAAPVIGFVGEPADPKGKWTVEVVLKDLVRDTKIPLSTFFVLN